ncbi:MAG: redoxin domain-containing protein [Methylococcales bacterium]
MFSRFLVVFFLVVASATAGAGAWYFFYEKNQSVAVGRKVDDFALLDQSGKFHRLSDQADGKAIVLYSHRPDCPAGKQGRRALNGLRQQFSKDSTAFLAIDASLEQSASTATANSGSLDPDAIPVLRDDSQLVTQSLGISRSGEALLIDSATWTVRYRGPIDDRSDYESENPEITRNYLAEAITSLQNGDSAGSTERPAIGCAIDFDGFENLASISYADSIAPILQKRCVICHQAGGIGPWSMDRFETVKAWTPKIREVILTKKMPPWHADPAVGKFSHSLALDPGEKKALISWIDAGAPRGTAADPLAGQALVSPPHWPLGEPDIVLKVPTFQIPAQGILAWQYIKLEVPIDQDTWVRAVHMKPGNREATHHIFGFVEYPKERKHEEPVWAEGANGFFAAYVPGFPVVPFPENSGRLLPKGAKIIFQRHYLTIGHPTEDNLELGLYLHKNPPDLEYKMATAVNMGIRIPPRARAHLETASVEFPEDGTLHAIYPHMHYRGHSIRVKAVYADAREEALLAVPDYHFHWQMAYQLQEPKSMPAGTKIVVDAEFDNSSRNPLNPDPEREVHWGPLSEDEMLVAYMMYTTSRKSRNTSELAPRTPGS